MKKLMIAAAAGVMAAGAFADPIVYDYKATVKHTYLKPKSVRTDVIQGRQIYVKYTKSSALKGYLIQDVDGVLGRRNGYITENYTAIDPNDNQEHSYTRFCDVRNITKNDAQPGNRCFLVVMNKSAEKDYRVPRIIPGILEAKWYDNKCNGATTVPAQGYLYLGGEIVARSNEIWGDGATQEEQSGIKIGTHADGTDQYYTFRDFEGFNGTRFVALDGMPGSRWGTFRHFYDNQRLETVLRYPSQILNMPDDVDPATDKADAMAAWRNNWRDLWFVNEEPDAAYIDSVNYVPESEVTRTAEFGIDDYWFTSAYLFGQYNQPAWNINTVEEFADCWMNGAGFGKAGYIPGKIAACCGRDLGSKATAYAIKQLSGSLKAGIYLCTENGDDSSHGNVAGGATQYLVRTGTLEDQLWLDITSNSWLGDVNHADLGYGMAAYWGLDGAYQLTKQDIWADGNLDLATTDVGYGNWSIKVTTALDRDIAAKSNGLSENVPPAWGFQQPSTGFTRPLFNAIDAAMGKLNNSCRFPVSLFGTPLKDNVQDYGMINYSFFKNYLAEDVLGGLNGRTVVDNGVVVP